MTIAQLAIVLGSIVAILGVVWRVWRAVRPVFKGVVDFLEDWNGERGRPGVPARPGVMERLAKVEADGQKVEQRLQRIEQQTAG